MLWKTDWKPETITTTNLRELSRILRHPELWPAEHKWSFETALVHTSCHTVGCAIGTWWLVMDTWYPSKRFDDERKISFPDMPMDEFIAILGVDSICSIYGVPASQVTPVMVADKIDQYVAAHS